MFMVSVVIPFYSNTGWLCEAVESVLKQDFKDFEIIVVNDGSPEDVSGFLERYGKRISYYSQKNAGPGPARNNGISHATGKYLAFLDSDDIWVPDKLRKQVEYMEQHPDLVWSHTNYTVFDAAGKEQCYDFSHLPMPLYPRALIYNPIQTSCIIIRRDFVERNHLRFADHMRYGQDGFFYLGIMLHGGNEIGLIPESLVRFRIRGRGNARFRARVKIQVAAQLYAYFQSEDFRKQRQPVPGIISFCFAWNHLNYKLLVKLEKGINHSGFSEIISRFLLLPSYVWGKVYYKVMR